MNRRALPVFRLLIRNISSKKPKPKFDFEADVDVVKSLLDGSCKARRHPGTLDVRTVSLPEPLKEAAHAVIQDYPEKNVQKDAKVLNQYLCSRQAALEPEEAKMRYHEVREKIKMEDDIDPDFPNIPEEERQRLHDSLRSKVYERMKKEVYHWQAIQYDTYKCVLYLAARLAPDFAALVQIMSDMKKRDPGFTPLTMLDFGSGVGSGMWAMDHVWPHTCREVVCVDSSSDMNDLADRLLRGGNADKPRLVREGGTFFKQFLPLSNLLKYDLVISSRSLFEIPNINMRLKTIDVLWQKTSGYLVLVETGSNEGYRLVQEARDYLLELSRKAQEEGEPNPEGYVFAPCPHDNFCPRFFDGSNIPCNFEVDYKPLALGRKQSAQREKFTYVVLKRGMREKSSEKQWPRLVEDPLCRKKHVVCRVCTPSGTLREVTATKRRHSAECYKLMRHSRWGDLVPVQLSEVPDPSNVDTQDGDELSEPEQIQN
ncbi:methyltransferase-like protein 17, mitochondrial isoform X1 [Portunus trituberculatus]|uniref:methyltransferase-like protein 17, mitochondrial isoform X1 n=1 Tax=Portunus trituberculatus TaxID=210409 RepID=UPI001E1D0EDE|nr:methyltransferase-like protein 17, mitochondrial isoform X1 [Portunus trituberculatus]XP_045118066.1 methyltransferase-like protein 17, mitochondrial isoform X1 [Portunus trituberculatus]XP_045118067.1 methyltransferase-like protein 17, mitochondrial isoform X1 [Portunus trituberculatus]XP_045118068.1 methyltransferase-like protein 17, mitochondrial isoform X1 [Portunus trituberculatus]XP_045118069.1 methyltransferase-like protein 17, mitochondrial isoform X1 [Portunus trituberculatus]XP_04